MGMLRRPRIGVLAGFATVALTVVAASPAQAISARSAAPAAPGSPVRLATAGHARPTLVYRHLALPAGAWAQIYSDGLAVVHRGSGGATEIQHLPLLNTQGGTSPAGYSAAELPSRGALIADLVRGHAAPYAAGQVVVIYRVGVRAPATTVTPAWMLRAPRPVVPSYTSVPDLNRLLAGLGVDTTHRLFTGLGQQRLLALHALAQRRLGRPLLNFASAFVLHLTRSSVAAAVSRLRASPGVAYAAPNWTVSTTDTPPIAVPRGVLAAARQQAIRPGGIGAAGRGTPADTAGVPGNYTLASSAQSMLNRPGDDVVPAYTALSQYGQLPGQGEVITNVSLGTLDDVSAVTNTSDPCHFYASAYGPTTVVINNQRYLDWPSMPPIPAYTASAGAALNPVGETCGDDPTLTEVGLDFSMMAPLPHADQRPSAQGTGLTDLLGIAPGASYRLVVPSSPGGAVTNVDAAFLAAAAQTPKPDVITASLGFGLDQYGFSSRYLEDDPMTEAIIASIVQADHIVVCVSAGDGLRTFTNAAVPPSGGAVATDTASSAASVTSLNDVAFSGAVSRDLDSGAIDVGATTLDDITAAPPQDPANVSLSYWHAFPATRYDGGRLFASGFGSRVNLAAPGDNVLSFSHPFGGGASDVQVNLEGGTSASAPEAAAAAAVVLQTARLTHDSGLIGNPLAVRDFLAGAGVQVPGVPQSDLPIGVGRQLDVGNAVQTLLAQAGTPAAAGVARVAVEQRQQRSALGGSFFTATDPGNISLTGRLSWAWLTIAPDWTGLPGSGVSYQLSMDTPGGAQLATTPWARLQPSAILAAAGLPLVSNQARTVNLAYQATQNGSVLAETHFSLTFGPSDGTVQSVQAPIVPPVVNGPVIPVHYDLTGLTGAANPILVVSHPGRVEPATGLFFRTAYAAALSGTSGTVDVPVSALPGAGIYGIGIQNAPGGWFSQNYSVYAFTRVAPTGDTQPPPPTLSAGGSAPGHFLEIGYNGSFQLSYDVSNVPGATGAIAEFSAPGPTSFNLYNTFSNPNGSQRDNDGVDTGSVAYVPLSGTSGTVTLNGGQLGLDPTMNHVIRVLATAGGQGTGEASGVSSISMDGIAPSDGGSVANGFGVSASGSDGFVTSDQQAADGSILGSVQPFDQVTGAVGKPAAQSPAAYTTAGDGCAGMFASDAGLYDKIDPVTGKNSYSVLDPVASGTIAGPWVPPAGYGQILCAADNQATPYAALLSAKPGPKLMVSSTDAAADTFTDQFNMTAQLPSLKVPIVGGYAQDTGLGDAVVALNDGSNPSGAATVALANLHSEQVTTIPGVTTSFPSGVAVDSGTHQAAVGSVEGLGVYDLHAGAGTLIQPGGSVYQHPAADPLRQEFLVEEVASPDFFGGSPNNNTMSSVLVTDESGHVLQRIEQFNFFNIFLFNMGDYLQANPSSATAFALGPGGMQLYPFHY
jgi:subtilase family protein